MSWLTCVTSTFPVSTMIRYVPVLTAVGRSIGRGRGTRGSGMFPRTAGRLSPRVWL
jgi:hypothetical protein